MNRLVTWEAMILLYQRERAPSVRITANGAANQNLRL